MLKIHKFEFNPFKVNTFIIFSLENGEGWIIDPGNLLDYENKRLSEFIIANNINLTKIFCTHGHLDHIFGVNYIKQNFKADFYFPTADLPLLINAHKQAEFFGLEIEPVKNPDFELLDSNHLMLNGFKADIISTPGHSPGGVSIVFVDSKSIFTGDVLFFESIGRTDLWGGDHSQLIDSIRTKIFSLPEDFEIFPGHGENTTIGYEKENNPFLI